ncbi:ABC transporter ATP-binding protein [Micromonospora sp. DT229]|uniref:ABC transporter ATP-binding protein n=1 Tax=Micromonospora sp. DT229 TaxID=3393430 RepID=UPI003CEB2546
MRAAVVVRWWNSLSPPDGLWRSASTVARAVWSVSPLLTLSLAATLIATAVFPLVQMIAVSTVVGGLPEAARDGTGSPAASAVYLGLATMAVAYFAAQVAPAAQWSLGRVLGARVDVLARDRIVDSALDPPGLEPVERDAVREAVTLAQDARSATFGADDAIRAVANLVSGRVQGLVAAGILVTFHWWAPLVLLLTFLPWDAYFRAEHGKVARSWVERTPEQARAAYFRRLGTDAAAGKELRVFGLAGFVRGRFAAHYLAGMTPLWRERTTNLRRFMPPVFTVTAGYLTVFGVLGWEFATGRQSLTATALYLLMAGQVWRLAPSFNDLSRLAIGATLLLSARRLADAPPESAARTAPAGRADVRPPGQIRFEGVSFAYPGGAEVLSGLDLTIEAGRSLAIVGDNGAGKTTLVKLLCGLYQPTAGRITVDGTDLRDLDAFAWRRHVAAVFQDYVRYPLTLRENVAIGAGDDADGDGAGRALADVAAADLVQRLPSGLDTVLGREFASGVELSGGQWQKVAVARALAGLHAGASVLILDEPTANLDVRAEAALFERILTVHQGSTTLLISHRFANVRRADRIVVLGGGRVVEDGSHAGLLAADGVYAAAFRLQAERFQDAHAAGTPSGERR